jgi:hypothetical protein
MADITPWLPAHAEWTDAAGTLWTRARRHRPAEQDARRRVRRPSTRVAIERSPGSPDVEWLDPAAQKDYWDSRIASHVEDGTGRCAEPDDDGFTYHLTSWRDVHGRRMILTSVNC